MAMPDVLSDGDRAILDYFRDHGTEAESRRAQIILMNDEDASTADIADAVSLSTSQVRYWVRKWEKQRIDIFPVLPEDEEVEEAAPIAPSGQIFGAEADALVEVRAPAVESVVVDVPSVRLPGVEGPRLPLELRDLIGIRPTDPMAEAGRKALFYHFERMLLHEPGSRLGDDIEAVHDMRVATRRMRSAFRLFKPFFESDAVRAHRRHLRRLGNTLGEVRDLEVFLDKAQNFVKKTPDVDLSPLIEDREKRLEKARRALIAYLDSPKFARFVNRFFKFLTTPGKGARPLPAPGEVAAYQVRHVAPRLIYEHYERVRAYETVMDNAAAPTLHALRIDLKRLRYTLEFFEDVLGPEARPVIEEIKGMQDHLGDLNDTEVAIKLLYAFVDEHHAAYSGVPLFMRPDIGGVVEYVAAQEAERYRLLDTFPAAWKYFLRDDVRRDLALAVAVL
jgi:CHAD domain-containing protein